MNMNNYENPGLQKCIWISIKIPAYKIRMEHLSKSLLTNMNGTVIESPHYNMPNKKCSCAVIMSSYSRICRFKRLIIFFNVVISFLWETKKRRYIFKRQFKMSNRHFQAETKKKKRVLCNNYLLTTTIFQIHHKNKLKNEYNII